MYIFYLIKTAHRKKKMNEIVKIEKMYEELICNTLHTCAQVKRILCDDLMVLIMACNIIIIVDVKVNWIIITKSQDVSNYFKLSVTRFYYYYWCN